MTYTAPGAWTTGETVAVGKLNALIDDLPALYNRLVHEVAVNYSATNWAPTNGAGTWETDTSGCTVTLTLEQTSMVVVLCVVKWYVTAAVDETMKFRIENDTDNTYSDSVGYFGSKDANNREMALVVSVFTGVTAGAKIFRLQGSRVSSSYTVNVPARFIAAVSVSTI